MRAHELIAETPLPPDWDAKALEIKKGNTFKTRLNYALDRAKRIGTGSSRVAFIIPFEGRDTVLKIAKNRKGLAQNNEEISILNDGYFGRMDILIPMIDFDKENGPDSTWIQTELAQPMKRPEDLMTYFGLSMRLLIDYADTLSGKNQHSPSLEQRIYALPEEQQERVFKYGGDFAALSDGSSIHLDDFTWYKNWGWYNNQPVIIDVGFAGSALAMYGYVK